MLSFDLVFPTKLLQQQFIYIKYAFKNNKYICIDRVYVHSIYFMCPWSSFKKFSIIVRLPKAFAGISFRYKTNKLMKSSLFLFLRALITNI